MPALALPFVATGIGEGIDWRRFALPRLEPKYGAFAATLILSVVWALSLLPWLVAQRVERKIAAAGLSILDKLIDNPLEQCYIAK